MSAGSVAAPLTRVAPVVSLAPHHNRYRDVTQGSAMLSYTTPVYVSVDQPRSVSLFYSSALANPMSFVQVDATDNSTEAPVKMSIRVRNEFGAWMTLENGTPGGVGELFYHAGAGTTRLAAQFPEPRGVPLSYSYDLVVRSWWADGQFTETTMPARVAKVGLHPAEGAATEFGVGWEMAGLQRLYNQGPALHVLENGTGTTFWEACDGSGCRFTGPEGDFTTITWDGSGWRRSYPDGSVVRFAAYQDNQRGRMDWVQDRFDNRTTFGYDAAHRVVSITDPVGKAITLGYTPEGTVAWIQDPMGRRATMVNYANYLYQINDPDGSIAVDLHIDTGTQQMKVRWGRGGRSAGGNTWEYAYDAHGQLASVKAPPVMVDNVSTQPVTNLKSLEAAVLPAPGTGSATTPAARVLPGDVRVDVTDPRGFTTRVAVDRFGAPIRVEAPLGLVSQIERDEHGRAIRTISPAGDTASAKFDGWKLTRTVDHSSDQVLDYFYSGNLLTSVVARADTTVPPLSTPADTVVATYEYSDHYLHPTLLFSRVGSEAHYYESVKYFHAGVRIAREWGPGGDRRYWHGQSGLANTDSVKDSGDGTTHFIRDAYGRVTDVRFTDQGTTLTTNTKYDLLGRDTSSTDAAGNTIRHTYYASGAVESITDPRGLVYRFEYDALGRVTKQSYPDGGADLFDYDRNGNLTRTTDRRNRQITYAYDALNTLVSRTADGQTTRFRSDPLGRFAVVANAESTDSVTFRRVGAGTEAVSTTLRGARAYNLTSQFDKQGLRTEVHSNDLATSLASTYHVGYDYENFNHGHLFKGLTNIGGRTANTAAPGSRFTHVLLPTGDSIYADHFKIRYSRTVLNNVLGERVGRNPRGQIVGKVQGVGSDTTREYLYDTDGRLAGTRDSRSSYELHCVTDPYSGEEYCNNVPAREVISEQYLTYDRSNNPTHSGATLGAGNRLASLGDFSMGDGYTLTYDESGNLKRKVGSGSLASDHSFDWNSLGQLTHVVVGGLWGFPPTEVTFGYDGLGRRVRKTVMGGADIRYLYDGENLVAELNAAGDVLAKYYYYPGIDQPHSMERGGQLYYYLRNSQGSVVGLLDAAGNLVNQYSYSEFGGSSASESVPQPFRFTGREYDEETGLYYYRARYYDPALQRFISQDPAGLSGGINPYTYASNDPLNRTDPFGTRDMCKWEKDFNFDFGSKAEDEVQWGRGMLTDKLDCKDNPFSILEASRFASWAGRDQGWYDRVKNDPASDLAYWQQMEQNAQLNAIEEKKTEAVGSYMNEPTLSNAEKIFFGVKARVAPVKPWLEGYAVGALSIGATPWVVGALAGEGVITALGLRASLMYPGVTPTANLAAGTLIPNTFVLEAGGSNFWVNANGAKHLVQSAISRAARYSPAVADAKMTATVASLRGAVATASQNGIVYGQLVRVGGWELVFGAPRAAGLFPVIYHALYRF